MRFSIPAGLTVALSLVSIAMAHSGGGYDSSLQAREYVDELSTRELLFDLTTRELIDELSDRLERRAFLYKCGFCHLEITEKNKLSKCHLSVSTFHEPPNGQKIEFRKRR
ncbi:hypothetical protein DFP72DRAFT_1076196 [Ephemerocybe angulata]|uniref:Uncharacterized protein n=1 Tax=Ephemerocybe angulata TaxID=980116 RepID=A0A8H6HI96_9AGAR|nr:hypothetical protein DFP72DRAFT_1076196 [Tulosesus angulatus]